MQWLGETEVTSTADTLRSADTPKYCTSQLYIQMILGPFNGWFSLGGDLIFDWNQSKKLPLRHHICHFEPFVCKISIARI